MISSQQQNLSVAWKQPLINEDRHKWLRWRKLNGLSWFTVVVLWLNSTLYVVYPMILVHIMISMCIDVLRVFIIIILKNLLMNTSHGNYHPPPSHCPHSFFRVFFFLSQQIHHGNVVFFFFKAINRCWNRWYTKQAVSRERYSAEMHLQHDGYESLHEFTNQKWSSHLHFYSWAQYDAMWICLWRIQSSPWSFSGDGFIARKSFSNGIAVVERFTAR